MASYKLTATDIIIRVRDNANIPADPANRDYKAYLDWVGAGNVADAADPEPAPQEPTPSAAVVLTAVLVAKGVVTQEEIDAAAVSVAGG